MAASMARDMRKRVSQASMHLPDTRPAPLPTLRAEAEAPLRVALRDVKRLGAVGSVCARGDATLQECLEQVLDGAISMTGADKGNIQLFHAGSSALRIAAHRGFEEPFLKYFAEVRPDDACCCGATMRDGKCLAVEDICQSPIFEGQPSLDVLLAAGVRAVQSTPLLSSAGRLLGMISTHFAQPHQVDECALALLHLLAMQTADVLERRQTEDATHRRLHQLRQLADVAARLNMASDVTSITSRVAEAARAVIGSHQAAMCYAEGGHWEGAIGAEWR
jgi:signal transduction protein with GAF and PtsI domain